MRTRLWCVPLVLLVPLSAFAQRVTFPERPPGGQHRVDEARVIGAAEAAEIDGIASALLADIGVPVRVATLRSLASRGAAGYTIERYAVELFNRWSIGSPEQHTGILLLLSRDDRAARIELGLAWSPGQRARAGQVMDELMMPELRDKRYAEALLAGVRGVAALARDEPPPPPPTRWWVLAIVAVVFVAGSALAFSLVQSGRHSWAWTVSAALAAVAWIALQWIARRLEAAARASAEGRGWQRGGSRADRGTPGAW